MLPKTKKELFKYIFELDDRLAEMVQESMPAVKKGKEVNNGKTNS
jgi:hypothetical protein